MPSSSFNQRELLFLFHCKAYVFILSFNKSKLIDARSSIPIMIDPVTQQNENATQFSGGADMLGDQLASGPISVGSRNILGACLLAFWVKNCLQELLKSECKVV